MARILVCGGRWYGTARLAYCEERLADEVIARNRKIAARQSAWLRHNLDKAVERLGLTEIITGGASGADFHAEDWARIQGVPCKVFYADWNRYGKAAGPIRNQRMLDEGKPDIVMAFPGGNGTADMVARARAAGIRVIEIKEPRDADTGQRVPDDAQGAEVGHEEDR